MRKFLLSVIVIMVTLCLSYTRQASATIMDGGIFNGDDTFIDTDTNLRWLDLDAIAPWLTNQGKFDAAIAKSYTIATEEVVNTLLTSLPNPGVNFDDYAGKMGSTIWGSNDIMWGLWDDWSTAALGYTWAFRGAPVWTSTSELGDRTQDSWSGIGVWAYQRDIANPIPEPTTIALLGIGLVGLAGAEVRRRRKKKAVDKS